MQFEIKVYRPEEGVSVRQLNAGDAEDARRQIEDQGYRVISLRKRFAGLNWPGFGQSFSVPLFSQELLALLEAGLSLFESIEILAHKSRHADSRQILSSLATHLREGLPFSRALANRPETFPALYIATIRTSEQTGNLNEALRRYLEYQRQLNQVRDKVVSASVYPVLLISVGTLVVLFLLAYVVPRFSKVYEDLGHDLPWISRLLIQWGHFFSENTGSIGLTLALALPLLGFALTRPAVRAFATRLLWALPALGEKMRLYQLARFTRTLAMLINAGIPFVTALEMVRGLLRQPALLHALQQSEQWIREGRSVSEAFAAHGLATEVGVRLLTVGERSGNLGQSMERIAKLYDDELARWIDWFARLFEPLLMIVIGFIIGLIVILMYLPIFELAGAIQ
ncbi:MAG: hypothetical protein RL748_443 [Pseudomonadota bacterium]|jgi:general secretion pathway protein F